METSNRNPVRRLHSRNRQKEYVTPSKRDVLCPFFNGIFIKTGQADVTNDFYGKCHDSNDNACVYKDQLTADVSFCKRYWKKDPLNMEFLYSEAVPPGAVWQDLRVKFEYERPFKNRKAVVELALIREQVEPVDLGDFLNDWQQWYETQPGNWMMQTNGSRQEILNTINQNGRSFWYNPAHIEATDYTHEFFVQARAGDDDIYGSVFRYNPSERSFYTFEWDSGGLGINGMAVYRNTQIGGVRTRTQVAHSPQLWGANRSYIHHVAISVMGNRIKVVVRRVNGSTYTHIATMEFLDIHPDAPLKGAWGPLTNSQPSTYFWELKYKKSILINASVEPLLQQEIPLLYKQQQGALHIVSNPLSHYFPQSLINEVALKHSVNPTSITSTEFWLKGTNVTEGVQFSSYATVNSVTTNAASSIAMTAFNYDSHINPAVANRVITDRTVPEIVSDVSPIDKSLTRVIINVNEKRLLDKIVVKVRGVTIRHIPNVTKNEYVIEFDPPIQVENGDEVSVHYMPTPFDMEYYRGEYIDTHDKIFKIEDNVLGWHHVPSYESEES